MTKNDLMYCVIYSSGARQYFYTREAAMIEVLNYGGIAIYPPKYA